MVRLNWGGLAIGSMAGLSTLATMGAVADAVVVSGGAGFVPVAAGTGLLAAVGGGALFARTKGLWRSPVDGRTSDLCEVLALDGPTLRLKGGRVAAVIELGGVDFGSRSEADANTLADLRSKVLKDLARLKVQIKIYARRTRQAPIKIDMTGHPVLDAINEAWEERFANASYRNQYFIYLEVGGDDVKKLNDAVRQAVAGLGEYSARTLEQAEAAEWVASLIAGRPVVVGPGDFITDSMYDVIRIGFDPQRGRVVHREDGQETETAALGVIGWGTNDTPALINGFLTLPLETEVLMILSPLDRDALPLMLKADKGQAGKLFGSTQLNQEYEEAISRVADDVDIFYDTTTTVFLSGLSSEIEQAINDCRIFARRFAHDLRSETAAIEAVWRSRLPGVAVMVRQRRLQTVNIASMVAFNAAPQGMERCDWGEGAIRDFATVSGQPYRLHMHKSEGERAAAHTLIIGPTGSGKTALALHLLGGCLQFEALRVIAFDSGQGMRPFCEAVGAYTQIGVDAAMNPLQRMEDDRDEAFVNRWLRTLAGVDDTAAYEAAQRGIEAIRDIPPGRRSLRSCLVSAFDPSPLRTGLRRWADEYGLGNLFNGDDNLGFASSITGFAMDELYDAPEAIAGAIDYIVHRIGRLKAEGEGLAIFIDEAPRLLANPVFRTEAKKWLLEMRKARGAVILAFQAATDVFNCGISEVILESCVTKILLPNSDARWEDYKALGCTESQFERLRKPVAGEWWALVLRPTEKVAIDIDLRALGPLLKLYRGGPAETLRMQNLQRDFGEDWVWHYING